MDIILENISKSFGEEKVLDNLSLTFPDGGTSYLKGPSGRGKTTLLNIIAGLTAPDSGKIHGTGGRKMAYVFQEPRLIPHMTVLQNVEFVLPEDISPDERHDRAMACLETVELAADASKLPASLSGGMTQRVSLARALAADADIILLDEAFSALDSELKERLFPRLNGIFSKRGCTVIIATHSEDAAALPASGIFCI